MFERFTVTTYGAQLLAKAIAGQTLNFTRMRIGSGALPSGQSEASRMELVAPIKYLAITGCAASGNVVTVTARFTNEGINAAFAFRELGLYATDPDRGEILYGYANAGATADTVPARATTAIEYELSLCPTVGNASSVTATINPNVAYLTTSELTTHTSNHANPHAVTAAQVGARPSNWTPTAADVGLGSVPNVATNDQTPTYGEAGSLTNLVSGEALSTGFGKIKRAITSLINHLASFTNPHGVTASQVAAVPAGKIFATLWTGSFTSGVINVEGMQNYHVYAVTVLHANGGACLTIGLRSGELMQCHGMRMPSNTPTTVFVSMSVSGNLVTFNADFSLGHESGGSHGTLGDCEVTQIIGII